MITDQWVGPNEIDQIKLIVDTLHETYQKLHGLSDVSVDLFQDAVGCGTTMAIRDCNGDIIGHAGITEAGGIGMYFDDGCNE